MKWFQPARHWSKHSSAGLSPTWRNAIVLVPSALDRTENDGRVPTQSAITGQSVTVQVTSPVPGACSTVKDTNGAPSPPEELHVVAVVLRPGHRGPPAADRDVVGQRLEDLALGNVHVHLVGVVVGDGRAAGAGRVVMGFS